MEMYFSPSESAATERSQVIAGFTGAGLSPTFEIEGMMWVATFAGSAVFVTFHEREGRLTFATLDLPMLSETDFGHKVFCALEDMGWIASEDVG